MVARSLLVYLCVGLLFALSSATHAQAADSDESSMDEGAHPAEYTEGLDLLESGDYDQARRAFERANQNNPRDPDILNMLAYSQRKAGQLDRAIETYREALSLRPRFPQAREYLAEAYLEATLREFETLESYGSEAVAERARIIEALQATVAQLPPPSEVLDKPDW